MLSASSQIDAIAELCTRLGIDFREEALGGDGGGLCAVGKNRVLFVDRDADAPTRLERCLAALANVDELDAVFVPPIIRDQLERRRAHLAENNHPTKNA